MQNTTTHTRRHTRCLILPGTVHWRDWTSGTTSRPRTEAKRARKPPRAFLALSSTYEGLGSGLLPTLLDFPTSLRCL